MIHPSAEVVSALNRLGRSNDFATVLDWIKGSKDETVNDLLITTNQVLVHQKQGYAQCLADISRLATAATNASAISAGADA